MHALRLLALAALASACSREQQQQQAAPLTSDECAGLVDRYASLLTTDAAVKDRIRDEAQVELAGCTKEIRRAAYVCAMRAPDPDAFEACLR